MSLVGHHPPLFQKDVRLSTTMVDGFWVAFWGSKNFAKPNLSTAAFREHLWFRKQIEVQVSTPLKAKKWFLHSVATEQNQVYSHSFPGHIPFDGEQNKYFHPFRTAPHKFIALPRDPPRWDWHQHNVSEHVRAKKHAISNQLESTQINSNPLKSTQIHSNPLKSTHIYSDLLTAKHCFYQGVITLFF